MAKIYFHVASFPLCMEAKPSQAIGIIFHPSYYVSNHLWISHRFLCTRPKSIHVRTFTDQIRFCVCRTFSKNGRRKKKQETNAGFVFTFTSILDLMLNAFVFVTLSFWFSLRLFQYAFYVSQGKLRESIVSPRKFHFSQQCVVCLWEKQAYTTRSIWQNFRYVRVFHSEYDYSVTIRMLRAKLSNDIRYIRTHFISYYYGICGVFINNINYKPNEVPSRTNLYRP